MDKTIKEIQTKTRDNGQALLEQNEKFESNIRRSNKYSRRRLGGI